MLLREAGKLEETGCPGNDTGELPESSGSRSKSSSKSLVLLGLPAPLNTLPQAPRTPQVLLPLIRGVGLSQAPSCVPSNKELLG